ncbi:hypothetical protein QJS10_CPB22g00332 [Acorus calamus]|uniref:Uncharacterized protein n=1 Tax=Acorus calamus TaxID=4465 RepID=A0AAV9BYX0_ACOCL|nr:hypothetical protein QJS10_CPB22g00332 [Acorus calamus]
MNDAKTRNSLILSLVLGKRKLWHYFKAHCIVVLTSYPIRKGQVVADFLLKFDPEDDLPNDAVKLDDSPYLLEW